MVSRCEAWPAAMPVSRPWHRRVADTLARWWRRERAWRELQALAHLDDRTLADIGWSTRFTRD
jgi:uncharacterized protein YjiS (DUF1127 family)